MCPDPTSFRPLPSPLPSPVDSETTDLEQDFVDISSTTTVADSAPGTPAEASSNFVSCLIYKLLEWVCDKFGETLKSESIGNYLDAAFPATAWQKKELSVSDDSVDLNTNPFAPPLRTRTLAYRQQAGDPKTIITDACHDMPPGTPFSEYNSSAQLSVAECLKQLCETDSKGSVTVQIPVCQSSYIQGSQRNHFVLLNATIVDGELAKAYLVDSKSGFIDYFYDGARHIEDQLWATEHLPFKCGSSFKVETRYLGDQSLINGTDCGRFAVAHARNFVSDGSTSYRPMNHEDFFQWCNSVQGDVDALAASKFANEESF